MKEVKKIKIITFRVTPDEYTQIESAGSASGYDPNDWCRQLALSCSSPDNRLTINERMISTEISHLRFLLLHGFNLLFRGDATEASAWAKLVTQADQSAKQIVIQLQSQPKRGSR